MGARKFDGLKFDRQKFDRQKFDRQVKRRTLRLPASARPTGESSVDRPDRRPRVLKVMTAFAYAAAMLSDVTTKDFDPPDGVPSTYVVDRDGVVRDRFIAVDDALLAEVVLPLLSQASAPARW